MVQLISHIFSDTDILGELNESYTGRGEVFSLKVIKLREIERIQILGSIGKPESNR